MHVSFESKISSCVACQDEIAVTITLLSMSSTKTRLKWKLTISTKLKSKIIPFVSPRFRIYCYTE